MSAWLGLGSDITRPLALKSSCTQLTVALQKERGMIPGYSSVGRVLAWGAWTLVPVPEPHKPVQWLAR